MNFSVTNKQPRGMALISVLLLSLLILGFIAAAVTSTPVTLLSAKGFGDQQQAEMAAEAGLAYAQTRLRQDPRWRGNIGAGPVRLTGAHDQTITVFEDHGNVVGLLVAGDGSRSQFRIRFNAEDGSGGADDAEDPTSDFSLSDLDYLSYNNISSHADLQRPAPLPPVAPREVLLVIEGRAGPALRDHDSTNVNAPPNGLRIVSDKIEVSLKPSFDDSLDAVLMAAGDVNVTLPTNARNGDEHMYVETDDRLVMPRVRTKQEFNVRGGDTINYRSSGIIQTASGAVGPDTNLSPAATVGSEGSARFLELEWDDVKKADPADPETVQLKAGTYVLNDQLRLDYYDLNYEDFQTAHAAGTLPPFVRVGSDMREVINNPAGLQPNAARFWRPDPVQRRIEAVVEFNTDVSVSPTSNADGLAFVTAQGPISALQDPSGAYPGVLDPTADKATANLGIWLGGTEQEAITLSATGDVLIGGVMYGDKGGITSEGDLTMRGATFLDSAQSQTDSTSISTNLYAKGDIEISTYRTTGKPSEGTEGKYGHFLSAGVTYAWGDIRVQTQEDAVGVGGGFRQRGAMVAYGGDPANNTPGEVGNSGDIDIRARRAVFVYDSSYVGLIEPNVPPDSFRVQSLTKR